MGRTLFVPSLLPILSSLLCPSLLFPPLPLPPSSFPSSPLPSLLLPPPPLPLFFCLFSLLSFLLLSSSSFPFSSWLARPVETSLPLTH